MSAILARIDRWWYMPAPAERIAVLRMLVGGFGLAYLVVRWPNLVSVTDFHERRFDPVGITTLAPDPISDALVRVLVLAAIVTGVAFVAGWKYRVSGPAFALLLLWVLTYRNSWGQIFHTENLLVMHVIILALAPAADALSLDARGRRPGPDGRYGWPVSLMCTVTVLTYFIGGETKLRNAGLDWLTDDNLRNYVAYDNLRKIQLGDPHSPLADLLVPHAWLFAPLAFFTLLVELCAPVALISRRFAMVWAAAAWGFHVGIFSLMAIVFPYPLLGFAFLPFFPVERLRLPSSLPFIARQRRLTEG